MRIAGWMPRASSRSSSSARASSACASPEQPQYVVGAALERALHEAQLQGERDEALLGAVVEVALQPPALGVARFDDARARGRELVVRVRVGERLRDEVGEVAEASLRARRERALVERGRDERAPQPARELDRSGDARAIPVRAQVDCDRAARVLRIRDAVRLAGAVHLDEGGVLAPELDHRADGEEQAAELAPASEHADRGGRVVADERGGGHAQRARRFLHDLAEDARRVGLGDDERRDAPQRRLLVRQSARRRLARGALGGDRGQDHRRQGGHAEEHLRREQAVRERAADERAGALRGIPDRDRRGRQQHPCGAGRPEPHGRPDQHREQHVRHVALRGEAGERDEHRDQRETLECLEPRRAVSAPRPRSALPG